MMGSHIGARAHRTSAPIPIARIHRRVRHVRPETALPRLDQRATEEPDEIHLHRTVPYEQPLEPAVEVPRLRTHAKPQRHTAERTLPKSTSSPSRTRGRLGGTRRH